MRLGARARITLLALCLLACNASSDDGAGGQAGMDGPVPEPTGGRASPAGSGSTAGMDRDAGAQDECGPAGSCDLLDSTACGEGMSCVLLRGPSSSDEDSGAPAADDDAGWSANELGPACIEAGAGRDGDACNGPGDCGPGLDCSAEKDGVCRRYCCELNRTAGCPSGQFCRVELRDEAGEMTGAALCDACDECDLLGDGCSAGSACYPLAAAGDTCRACLPRGELAPGSPCRFSNECAAQSACLRIGEQLRCSALCALDGRACGEGESCVAIEGDLLGKGLGLCKTDSSEP